MVFFRSAGIVDGGLAVVDVSVLRTIIVKVLMSVDVMINTMQRAKHVRYHSI